MGGVGHAVVEILRQRNLPVRAFVRREDERAEALRAIGAEVVVGDLTRAGDVARALEGCRRMFFGMSVSASYLEATVTAMIDSRTMSRRSREGRRRAFVTMSHGTPSCSGQPPERCGKRAGDGHPGAHPRCGSGRDTRLLRPTLAILGNAPSAFHRLENSDTEVGQIIRAAAGDEVAVNH